MTVKPHPSGRPIRREVRHRYPMSPGYRIGFVLPRLNLPEQPEHNTHAIGFMTERRDIEWWETVAKDRSR